MSVYFDSSALVKLIQREPESAALAAYFDALDRPRVTSAIARVEVVRAVAPAGRAAVTHARALLERMDELVVGRGLLDRAGDLTAGVRSLDAVHLASALQLGTMLTALVTYDRRMAVAADALGIDVVAPG